MHECKQTQQSVIVSVKVSVGVGFMTRVPQAVDKLPAAHVGGGKRYSGRSGDKTYRMTQRRVITGSKNAVDRSSVDIILVNEVINTL